LHDGVVTFLQVAEFVCCRYICHSLQKSLSRYIDFDEIWAAAGTPHHVFGLHPDQMMQISGAQVADFTSLSK
jgi:hypothetical protein